MNGGGRSKCHVCHAQTLRVREGLVVPHLLVGGYPCPGGGQPPFAPHVTAAMKRDLRSIHRQLQALGRRVDKILEDT